VGAAAEWLRRTVQFSPAPVLAMTLRWDIVAWNELTTRVFRDYGAVPEAERNLLKIVMTDARYRRDPEGHEQMARNLLGEFRIDFGRCAGDPKFEQLIAELCDAAPEFSKLWSKVDLWGSPRALVVQSEKLGDLYFDRVAYVPEFQPAIRVVMFIPGEPNTARVIADLEQPMQESSATWNGTRHLSAASGAVRVRAVS
jgi:hypothetical protein